MVISGRARRMWLVLALSGCTGTIEDPSVSRDVGTSQGDDTPDGIPDVDTDGDGIPDLDTGKPSSGDGSDQSGDGSPSDGDEAPAIDPNAFTYATLGERCSGGTRQRFVVVSRAQGSCESHARALDDGTATDTLRIALGADGSYSGKSQLCDAAGCRDVDVNGVLGGDGASFELEAGLDEGTLDRALTLNPCDYDLAAPPSRDTVAANVRISELALYQAVKVSLAQNGQPSQNRNGPVIAGREALVRTFVTPEAGFTARTLIARLTLDHGDGAPEVLEARVNVSGASRDDAIESTLNFDLSAEQVRANTQYSVSLHEAESCAGVPTADNAAARVPSEGLTALSADQPGNPFRLVLIPVAYNGDGSGRVPDLNAERVEAFRQHIYSMFPLANVEVSVGSTMGFNGAVASNGDGWGALLDQCLAQRDAEGPDPKTYYYCIFNPGSSFRNYCGGGCVAGLGPVPRASDAFRRASIGLGFNESDAAGTMIHEIGHTLGLPHAPCGGVAGPDPNFPYSGGLIGAWGYDQLDGSLLNPQHSDFMGYCGQPWISDYNYRLVYQRFRDVLGAPQLAGPKRDLMSIVVGTDGALSAGHRMALRHMPPGDAITVHYEAEDGSEVARSSGTFTALSHTAGGILYLPAAPEGAVRVTINDFGSLAL